MEGPLTSASYKATFAVTKAGEYIGYLKLGRQPLPGSPFQVFVAPAETHPDYCVVRHPSPSCL